MNAEMKKKWVEGLRSQKYRQVRGSLFAGAEDSEGHTIVRCCVLGVLNDVSGLGYWHRDGYLVETPGQFSECLWRERVARDRADNEDYWEFLNSPGPGGVRRPDLREYQDSYASSVVETIRDCFLLEHEFIHPEVLKAAELHSLDLEVEFEGQQLPLHELNDMGVPFEVIADLIEAQL